MSFVNDLPNPIRELADEIRECIDDDVAFPGGVFSRYNPQAPVKSAVIVPAAQWGDPDPDEETFCHRAVRLDVSLTLAAGGHPGDALEWFESRVAHVIARLDADGPVGVERWGQPLEVAGSNGSVLEVLIELTPGAVDFDPED